MAKHRLDDMFEEFLDKGARATATPRLKSVATYLVAMLLKLDEQGSAADPESFTLFGGLLHQCRKELARRNEALPENVYNIWREKIEEIEGDK